MNNYKSQILQEKSTNIYSCKQEKTTMILSQIMQNRQDDIGEIF